MDVIAEFFIAAVLLILFFLTLLKELNCIKGLSKQFSIFMHFIPSWSFFAPNPYQSDYFLLYRSITSTNTFGKWKQAFYLEKRSFLYSLFWNPNKLFLKAIIDAVMDLLQIVNTIKDKNSICLSLPYLHLLNYVHSLGKHPTTAKIQFVIMKREGREEPQILFLSQAHPVAKQDEY